MGYRPLASQRLLSAMIAYYQFTTACSFLPFFFLSHPAPVHATYNLFQPRGPEGMTTAEQKRKEAEERGRQQCKSTKCQVWTGKKPGGTTRRWEDRQMEREKEKDLRPEVAFAQSHSPICHERWWHLSSSYGNTLDCSGSQLEGRNSKMGHWSVLTGQRGKKKYAECK